jgi:hypothetical protein
MGKRLSLAPLQEDPYHCELLGDIKIERSFDFLANIAVRIAEKMAL